MEGIVMIAIGNKGQYVVNTAVFDIRKGRQLFCHGIFIGDIVDCCAEIGDSEPECICEIGVAELRTGHEAVILQQAGSGFYKCNIGEYRIRFASACIKVNIINVPLVNIALPAWQVAVGHACVIAEAEHETLVEIF